MSNTIKQTVWQLYYEGYMVHEIAEILCISEWNVIQVLQPAGY